MTNMAQHTAQPAQPLQPQPPGGDDNENVVPDMVTRAEIKLTTFLTEHNISFNTIDHLTDLFKNIFPDSAIVQRITLKRTQATSILKNVGTISQESVVNAMKRNHFFIIIDETTDTSTSKTCAVVVKCYFCLPVWVFLFSMVLCSL